MINSIAKNASWLGAGQIVGKVVSLLAYASITRRLGEAGFGRFNYSFSLMEIVAIASLLGLPILYTRHLAAGRPLLAEATVVAKHQLTLAVVLLATVGVSLTAGHFPVHLHLLMLAAMIARGYMMFGSAGLRGREQMRPEAFAHVIGRVVFAVCAGAGVWVVPAEHVVSVAFIGFLAGELASTLAISVAMNRVGLRWRPSGPPKARLLAVAKDSIPFAAAALLGVIAVRIDAVMLRDLLGGAAGDSASGLYGAAYRVMEVAHFLPAAIAAALFPALVRIGRAQGHMPLATVVKAGVGLGSIGCFGALVLALTAEDLLPLFAGASFAPAVPALQVLALTLPFTFANYALGSAVFACGREMAGFLGAIICVAVNVGGNYWAITTDPERAMVWAASFTIASEAILTLSHLAILTHQRRRERAQRRTQSTAV
jgi:O-antigen/teichoic acid export membrane protein